MNIEIKEYDEENILIYIEGRVDTSNIDKLDETILSFVDKNPELFYQIDLEKLNYISSAGLRFFLKLKKRGINFKIVNASVEVYEIFDMTGFTKILDVTKRIRDISVDGCTVIGRGANGIVYRLDDETILKLYYDDDSLEQVKEERRHAENALLAGVPTAISFDIVKSGDKYGTVFELLDSKSLVGVLNENPQTLGENVDEFITLLKEIHDIDKSQITEVELPSAKDRLLSWIEFIGDSVDASVVDGIKAVAASVTDQTCVIHGDSQPNNVMVTRDGFLFIDMDTLSYGDPIFEFAYLHSTLVGYNEAVGNSDFVGMSPKLCTDFWYKAFEGYYKDESGDKLEEIRRKCKIISAVQVFRNMLKHKERRGDEAYNRAKSYLCSFFA